MIFSLFWRSILFYFILLAAVRLMGKREIGSLSPMDLVVAILLAELIVPPIEDPQRPVWDGVVPVATVVGLQLSLAYLCLKSEWIRTLVYGRSSVVIRDGRIVESEMRRVRYNLDDLLEQLREKGMADVADVEIAILETTGKLSVVPRSERRPLQPADVGVPVERAGVPHVLVRDGKVDENALRAIGRDRAWLSQMLAARGLRRAEDVLLASVDRKGRLFVQETDRAGRARARAGSAAERSVESDRDPHSAPRRE